MKTAKRPSGVSESGAVQVLAGQLMFFGRVVDGVDGDTESCGGAEQPESGVGAGGSDFEDAFGALFVDQQFEEASGGGGDVQHLLSACCGAGIVCGALLVNFREEFVEAWVVGGQLVHGAN